MASISINVGAGVRLDRLQIDINASSSRFKQAHEEQRMAALPLAASYQVEANVGAKTFDSLAAVLYLAETRRLVKCGASFTEPSRGAAILRSMLDEAKLNAPDVYVAEGLERGENLRQKFPAARLSFIEEPDIARELAQDQVVLPWLPAAALGAPKSLPSIEPESVFVCLGGLGTVSDAMLNNPDLVLDRILWAGYWTKIASGYDQTTRQTMFRYDTTWHHRINPIAAQYVLAQRERVRKIPIYVIDEPLVALSYKEEHALEDALAAAQGTDDWEQRVLNFSLLGKMTMGLRNMMTAYIAIHPECVTKVERFTCNFDGRGELALVPDACGLLHIVTEVHDLKSISKTLFDKICLKA